MPHMLCDSLNVEVIYTLNINPFQIEFHWLNQDQDTNNFIDIGQCDGNCRSSQYSTFTVSKSLSRESVKFSSFEKKNNNSI